MQEIDGLPRRFQDGRNRRYRLHSFGQQRSDPRLKTHLQRDQSVNIRECKKLTDWRDQKLKQESNMKIM